MSTPPANKLKTLKAANQAEILRSHQRDDEFVRGLREQLIDLLHGFGYRKHLPFLQSEVPFRLLYFVFTSALGNQTLGEEYTGIVQANLRARKVPSLSARIFSACLEAFGERGLVLLLEKWKKNINDSQSALTPEARVFLNSFIDRLKLALPLLICVHKGLFYIFGRYYSWGKRLSGVDYAKVYGRRPDDGVSWGLRLLGIATIAQCFLKMYQCATKVDDEENTVVQKDQGKNCQMCLDSVAETATPCGHLYCWNCIAHWMPGRGYCPTCRGPFDASMIIHLMNR